MVKILEYNKKSGKLAKNIKINIEDYTENEYDDDGHFIGKKKNGYMLEQIIKVDLPIDNVLVNNIVRGIGKFIPSAQINIGYTLQDERPSQMKMLARAVSDAKDKARIMTEAGGCSLGKIISIDYRFQNTHIASQARYIHSNSEAKASTASSLDITPDDLIISDTVDVTFELINDPQPFSTMSKKYEIRNSTAEFLIFQIKGKEDGVQVVYHNESVWCTQKAMTELLMYEFQPLANLAIRNVKGEITREEVSQKLREHYGDNLYDEPKTGLDGGYEILPPDSPKIKEIEEYNRRLRPALYEGVDKKRNRRNLR